MANYDLEKRTFEFAKRVRAFVKQLPRTVCNQVDVPQLVKASGSQGANYLEANNALSKKEFRMRIRIARKETRESHYWLRLLDMQGASPLEKERHELLREAEELAKIFGAILRNSE